MIQVEKILSVEEENRPTWTFMILLYCFSDHELKMNIDAVKLNIKLLLFYCFRVQLLKLHIYNQH